MAETIVSRIGEAIAQYPQALGHVAGVADSVVHGEMQVAVAASRTDPTLQLLAGRLGRVFVPGLVVAGGDPADPEQPALMKDRHPIDGRAAAYVCQDFTCDLPTTDADELERQVLRLMGNGTRNAAARHT